MTPESEALLAAAAKLQAAELLFKEGLNGDAASRAYYAVFHAISALHLANGNTFSSHAQLIGRFNKDFVRTGLFAPEYTRIVTRLFEDRQLGDYDAVTAMADDQAKRDVADARRLIDAIRA
ncbi:HEPN domain-containing protein [Thiorhodococcus mannitoliphagus]|uniref:HEPN domain-containing protein n=1 Tax=Thiorhodococcus mannitoliphagus TaxID=329406 RepID=A0A6P1E1F9_9GAMM|nr:HEPN domain-containing protein [Thiorhodococcus mannitoliphagus]NEX23630.1 HEPN domain-containing protein [Thiorhodococcus mannitoliphagus]